MSNLTKVVLGVAVIALAYAYSVLYSLPEAKTMPVSAGPISI